MNKFEGIRHHTFDLDISLWKKNGYTLVVLYKLYCYYLYQFTICDFEIFIFIFYGHSSFIVDVIIVIILVRSQPRWDADMLLWFDVLYVNLVDRSKPKTVLWVPKI
jgi:hypothetical protein